MVSCGKCNHILKIVTNLVFVTDSVVIVDFFSWCLVFFSDIGAYKKM